MSANATVSTPASPSVDPLPVTAARAHHQPSGGAQGQATGIEGQAREILALRKRLNQIYVKHTGQPIEEIERKLERDSYMSAEEAKEFGLIDEVVLERPAAPAEAQKG